MPQHLQFLAAQTAAEPSPEYDGFIGWVLSLMESLGEVGVGIAVLVETFVPPMPSEAILPGAGFLAFDGRMNAVLAAIAATLGALVGAWIWYAIGAAVGRERTRNIVNRIPLMDYDDFDKAEAFFLKWGGLAVFVGRCVPMIRSFISIPAGIERMNFWKFSAYTFAGSLVWNSIWVGLGYGFGPVIRPVLSQWSGILSNAVLVLLVLIFLVFIVLRLRRNARRRRESTAREVAAQ